MAKKSVKNRNEQRAKLIKKFKAKRDKFRDDAVNLNLSDKERLEARQKLQDMSRDASPSRRRNRCKLCGRPRGYNRLTGLCRLHMRIATINGMVPGMRKSSW